MDLDDLIEASPRGVARFLEHAIELGYKPIVIEKGAESNCGWTIAYGVGQLTYMLVYDVAAGTRRYPAKNAVRQETGLKGRFDLLKLRNQGLENVASEMKAGCISPFFSEDFDAEKLYIAIDLAGVIENKPVKFPANSRYFAMTLFEVFQTLRSLYGKDGVNIKYLFKD